MVRNIKTINEISDGVKVPLFLVRSGLREMLEAGVIDLISDKYQITDKGKQKI